MTEAVADGGKRGMEVCGHGLLLPLNWACRFFERPDETVLPVLAPWLTGCLGPEVTRAERTNLEGGMTFFHPCKRILFELGHVGFVWC